MKKAGLVIFFLIFTAGVWSQAVRKYSNEFLNIGVDAASLAMANAVTASSSDVNSGYWNPAGLVHLEDNELALMHASYFANIALYDYAAFATPIDDRSALGVSLIRFGVDDILNTTQLIDANGNIDYNRIRLFSTADYAFTLSYARELPVQGLNLGANAKVIRRIIGDFASSWGFGFDLGLQYASGNWDFGLMARDITTSVNTWAIDEEQFATISNAVEGQNQDLPETLEITIPKLQLGIARNWEIHYDYTIKAEVDLMMRFTQTNDILSSSSVSATPAAGLEFGYTGIVFLRAGVGNFQELTQLDGSNRIGFQPNIGVGFQYRGIHIDYALTDIGDQSAAVYSNIFSLKLDWELFR
ncbi:PorV/PorQ family protein [Leeuwenhoekiella sp. MAR_2009_132]|uniref:putative type IX sorting system protein PorV2 n=1 Tax=Leeuwenhoekiella sp. MAR_2009_132 TaxID=1392489 RepID=UPI000B320A52|nr:PorV/PorQ family protein [Leeuwenhoekiella sp. MAR_2009_132]